MSRHPPLAGGGGGNLGAAYYAALAASRLGISPTDKNFAFDFDEFNKATSTTVQTSWSNSATGTGALATRISGSAGGVHQATTGATAASSMEILGTSILASDVTTKKWHMAWRQKVTTAITAQTRAVSGFANIAFTKTITAGVFGPADTVNFRMQYDATYLAAGSTLDLGVPIDLAYHVFEIYCKGDSKIYARVDEGPELSVTPAANPSDGCYLFGGIINGTDAVARIIERDFVASAFPRT